MEAPNPHRPASLFCHHGTQLDDESLRTFIIETEAIVNSRPFSIDHNDSLEPLTPNYLVTMESKVVLPPLDAFPRADLYSRIRWHKVQHPAGEFGHK